MMTSETTNKTEVTLSEESKIYSDQLLKLLSDNEVFLNLARKNQWNHQLFSREQFNDLIQLLLHSSDEIASHIKQHQPFVAGNLEVFVEVSEINENFEPTSVPEAKKELIRTHYIILQNLKLFLEDKLFHYQGEKVELAGKLYENHAMVHAILERVSH